MSHRVPLSFDLITLMLLGQRSKLKLLKRLPLRKPFRSGLTRALVILLTGIKYTACDVIQKYLSSNPLRPKCVQHVSPGSLGVD